MDAEETYEQLKKRRGELKTIGANLQDIYDWFVKNRCEMTVVIDYHDLEIAIDEIDNTICDIEGEMQLLEEELNPASDDDSKDYLHGC